VFLGRLTRLALNTSGNTHRIQRAHSDDRQNSLDERVGPDRLQHCTMQQPKRLVSTGAFHSKTFTKMRVGGFMELILLFNLTTVALLIVAELADLFRDSSRFGA
jgi:hypothetical protein